METSGVRIQETIINHSSCFCFVFLKMIYLGKRGRSRGRGREDEWMLVVHFLPKCRKPPVLSQAGGRNQDLQRDLHMWPGYDKKGQLDFEIFFLMILSLRCVKTIAIEVMKCHQEWLCMIQCTELPGWISGELCWVRIKCPFPKTAFYLILGMKNSRNGGQFVRN